MGNMMVINANYDVKMAITRDMKNLLTRVSNDLKDLSQITFASPQGSTGSSTFFDIKWKPPPFFF